MDTSNRNKNEFLGMPYGTANNQLRKMILFDLVKRCGLDTCYRCGKKIENIDDLSIEHKKAWLGVDVKLFWDLNNIAFSHLNCNIGSGRRKERSPIIHGTVSGYRYNGCRCEKCRETHNEYVRRWKKRKLLGIV